MASSAEDETLLTPKAQESRYDSPVDCCTVENPRRGFSSPSAIRADGERHVPHSFLFLCQNFVLPPPSSEGGNVPLRTSAESFGEPHSTLKEIHPQVAVLSVRLRRGVACVHMLRRCKKIAEPTRTEDAPNLRAKDFGARRAGSTKSPLSIFNCPFAKQQVTASPLSSPRRWGCCARGDCRSRSCPHRHRSA